MPLYHVIIAHLTLTLILLVIYVLYSLILFKFLRRKHHIQTNQEHSNILSAGDNLEMMALSTPGGPGSGDIDRRSTITAIHSLAIITRFIRAAKYVLILLIVCTMAWLAWIVILYDDIFALLTGSWNETLAKNNCTASGQNIDKNLSMRYFLFCTSELCCQFRTTFFQHPDLPS